MKSRAITKLACLSALTISVALSAPSAIAQDSGLYALAGVGVVSLDSTSITTIGAQGTYEDRDTGFRAGIGLRVSDNMATEITVQSLGEFGVAATKLEATAATLWLVGIAPMTESLGLQAKLGATVYDADVGALNETGGGLSFGVGANYRILRNLEITYEYERFQAKIFAGRSSFDVYSVGAKLHF
jgi:hypothetical protein